MSRIESASYIGRNDFVCELEPLQRKLRRQRETSEVKDDVVATKFMRWRGDGLRRVSERQKNGEVASLP